MADCKPMRIPLQPQGYYRLPQLKQAEVYAVANRGGRIFPIVTVTVFVILLAPANILSLWIYREVGGENIRTAAIMSFIGWTMFFAPLVVRFVSLPLLAQRIGKELKRRAALEDRSPEEIR